MSIDWSKAPEGATHHHVETETTSEHWKKEGFFCVVGFEAEGWKREILPYPINRYTTRPAPWTGEGLPPVGTVCEYLGAHQYNEWSEVKIFAAWRNFVFVDFTDGWRQEDNPKRFRPIRTPEQIAAEERTEAIDKMVEFFVNYYGNPKGSEQYLLICSSLHDNGYRKQVAP